MPVNLSLQISNVFDFGLDHCDSHNCEADQTCVTLSDKFICVCNDSDAFLVNGNCTLPGSTAEVSIR